MSSARHSCSHTRQVSRPAREPIVLSPGVLLALSNHDHRWQDSLLKNVGEGFYPGQERLPRTLIEHLAATSRPRVILYSLIRGQLIAH